MVKRKEMKKVKIGKKFRNYQKDKRYILKFVPKLRKIKKRDGR
jgi:hypothetical protein